MDPTMKTDVRKLVRRLDEIDRQEGRMKKYLEGLTFEKPSAKKRRKMALARWRRRVRVRLPEVRAFDGSIWTRDGRLLTPRKKGS